MPQQEEMQESGVWQTLPSLNVKANTVPKIIRPDNQPVTTKPLPLKASASTIFARFAPK
jgi:hypothetical protein